MEYRTDMELQEVIAKAAALTFGFAAPGRDRKGYLSKVS
jgi:hypothetical protein